MDKTIEEIQNMNRVELLEFLKTFNIHKKYDFQEYLERKNVVLLKMQEFNIDVKDINLERTYSGNVVFSQEYK